jgi:hypothetical protein
MSNTLANPITVTVTGISFTTSVASASATLPFDSAGNVPKYIRVACTGAACIRLGTGTPVAVNTDLLIGPGDSVILATGGLTKIAAIWADAAGSGVFSGAGRVQVSPMENA